MTKYVTISIFHMHSYDNILYAYHKGDLKYAPKYIPLKAEALHDF